MSINIYRNTFISVHFLIIENIIALLLIALFKPQIYYSFFKVIGLCIVFLTCSSYYVEAWFYKNREMSIPLKLHIKISLSYILSAMMYFYVAAID